MSNLTLYVYTNRSIYPELHKLGAGNFINSCLGLQLGLGEVVKLLATLWVVSMARMALTVVRVPKWVQIPQCGSLGLGCPCNRQKLNLSHP